MKLDLSSNEIIKDMENMETDLKKGVDICNSEDGKCSIKEHQLLNNLLTEIRILKDIVKEIHEKK